MAHIVDVARYILDKFPAITTMKLQKLVFYSQAHHLETTGKPLFSDGFEAWIAGPVAPTLYELHRGEFLIFPGHFGELEGMLSYAEQNLIDDVVAHLGGLTGREIAERTHAEDPWKNARGDLPLEARSHEKITQEAILEYYSAHPALQS